MLYIRRYGVISVLLGWVFGLGKGGLGGGEAGRIAAYKDFFFSWVLIYILSCREGHFHWVKWADHHHAYGSGVFWVILCCFSLYSILYLDANDIINHDWVLLSVINASPYIASLHGS